MTTLFYPYTTLAMVQATCGNRDSDKEDIIRESINLASRMVEEITKRDFRYHDYSSTAVVVKRGWFAGREIWLPWPAITLTEISVNNTVLDATAYALMENERAASIMTAAESWDSTTGLPVVYTETQREWTPLFGKADAVPGSFFPDPTVTLVRIKGTFGYPLVGSSTAVPSDSLPGTIKRAATLIAAAVSGLNRHETVGFEGDRVSVSDTRVPAEAMTLLKPWIFGSY